MSDFLRVPPLVLYRRMANADIKGSATPTEIEKLHAEPALWLRALIRIRREVQNHIAEDRRSLRQNAPASGVQQSDYLVFKRAYDDRHRARLHFLQKLENRAADVKSLLGHRSIVDELMMGDMIEFAIEIAEMAADGDLRGVRDKANHAAELWAAAYERHAPNA